MAKKKNTWPERLRDLRQRYRLTQAAAAERIGVATRTWIAWENAQRVPGRLTQILLRSAFPKDF